MVRSLVEADLHTHTLASGHAYSTVAELAAVAGERGVKLLGITDHGPGLPGGAHEYHFWNLRVLPRVLKDVAILRGVEANVMGRDGRLDLEEEILAELDVVAVAFHPYGGLRGETQAECTEIFLAALDNPYADFVAHPGNPLFRVDVRAVVEKAKERGIVIEVNNSSFLSSTSRMGAEVLDLDFIIAAGEAGLPLLVNSDAHFSDHVGRVEAAMALVHEAGYPEELVLSLEARRVLDYLHSRGRAADISLDPSGVPVARPLPSAGKQHRPAQGVLE